MSAGAAAWAIEALAASALLMLVILALRGPIRRAFGPEAAYALWALPAIRLVLPPQPGEWHLTRLIEPFTRRAIEAPGMVVGVMRPDAVPATVDISALPQIDLSVAGHHASAVLVPPVPVAHGPNLALLLLGLWMVGVAGLLMVHLIAHRRFCRRLLAGSSSLSEMNGIAVIETDAATGPLAFGIWRRYVAFPRDFAERYDAAERDLALAHELGHHARGDLIANAIALLVLALHWFNPIAWRAFRAFRADQEMANDARVLAGRDPSLRHAYACAILKSAHGGALSPACHLHTIDEIKGRIRMIARHRASRRRRLAGGAAIAALTVAGLGVTASGTAAAERIKARVSAATGMKLPAATMPSLAAMPAIAATSVTPTAAEQATTPVETVSLPASTAAIDESDQVGQSMPVPPAPPAPPEQPAAPDAPPAPPAPPVSFSGKTHRIVVRDSGHGRHERRVEVITSDNGDWPKVPPVPEVSSTTCPGNDDAKPVVITEASDRHGAPRRIVICTNRIEHLSVRAQRQAEMAVDTARIERDAYAHALDGLRHARETMLANRAMAEDARREALADIDESITGIEADIAHIH